MSHKNDDCEFCDDDEEDDFGDNHDTQCEQGLPMKHLKA